MFVYIYCSSLHFARILISIRYNIDVCFNIQEFLYVCYKGSPGYDKTMSFSWFPVNGRMWGTSSFDETHTFKFVT